jgi:hypothetical protein
MHTSIPSGRQPAFRLRLSVLLFFAFVGIVQQYAQTVSQKKPVAEYENLPLSSREFQSNMRKYFCVCHRESLPKPEDLIGHDVIVFLEYNPPMHSWEPATANYQLFFHPALQQRILGYLKGKK